MNTPRVSTCFIVLGCLLPAQATLDDLPQKVVSAGYTARSGTIIETGILAVKGREVTTAHSLVTCRGDCEVTVHDLTLKADEINFHQDTGEAEAHGNVRIAVVPHRSPSAQK
jgi:lipopolysaccharide assembly outer membrane protein LptD (OstA)